MSYILSKTDHGCSNVLHLRLLRVKEQEETLVNINTLLNFHMFAHAHYTKLSHVCTKMAKLKSDFTRLSVCLSTILEFHNKWLLFLGQHCFSFLNIHVYLWKFCKTLQLLRSGGNTHTQIHRYTDTQIHRHTNWLLQPLTYAWVNNQK